MAKAQETALDSTSLPSSTHLITVPYPSTHAPTRLVAHLTRFEGPSFLLWCGACEEGWSIPSADEQLQKQATSSLLIEEHHAPQVQSKEPTGCLVTEWAVAMTNPRNKATASTSLFRSNSDLSKPMSARLAKRFAISQLFLSLSLPANLISALDGPFGTSEGGKALLMVEGALGDILKQVSVTAAPHGGR